MKLLTYWANLFQMRHLFFVQKDTIIFLDLIIKQIFVGDI
jgi:hypothetical protein